jgi:hypothetical protein
LWHWPQLQDVLTMVHEYAMPHFFLTLNVNEMTQSQWHEFNDMECLVKQLHENMSWKGLSYGMCNIISFTCWYIYASIYIKWWWNFGKIKELSITTLWICSCSYYIMGSWIWFGRITNEIVTFVLTMFDETIAKFIPPNDSLQF